MIAIDASAMLAYLFREPGHEQVKPHLTNGCMSTVNVSEVLARFARDGHATDALSNAMKASGIEFVAFAEAHAVLAAQWVPATRRLGLSIGDRACLALARERGIPALTADRIWLDADVGVNVKLIR